MVFTADIADHKREILEKVRRQNAEFCQTCHKSDGPPSIPPMFPHHPLDRRLWKKGFNYLGLCKAIKDSTRHETDSQKHCTAEDAELAMRYGG